MEKAKKKWSQDHATKNNQIVIDLYLQHLQSHAPYVMATSSMAISERGSEPLMPSMMI